jgi:response regulator RpfG family c-di-GMP phosphodiesterase
VSAKVLCVDDEPYILSAFRRQLRQFDLETAVGPEAGLQALETKGPFAVVVSDLRMPVMDGVQFLARVKEASPDTIRIMLTGQADLRSASMAVNEGCIFRFLLKPCPAEVLCRALEAGLDQFRLLNAERDLLEQTLHGAVEVLSEVLSLVVPEAFGRALRMRRYVREMCKHLQAANLWQYEVAAMLSQIGSIAVPPDLLEKVELGEKLDEDDRQTYCGQYQQAYDLLAKIPRLDLIAQMVRGQSGTRSTPGNMPGDPAALGIRMLRVARAFDELVTAGKSPESAVVRMRVSHPAESALLDALASMGEVDASLELRRVRIAQLSSGMVLRADVRSRTGQLLLGKGQEITPSVIARLRVFGASTTGVIEPLSVAVRGNEV